MKIEIPHRWEYDSRSVGRWTAGSVRFSVPNFPSDVPNHEPASTSSPQPTSPPPGSPAQTALQAQAVRSCRDPHADRHAGLCPHDGRKRRGDAGFHDAHHALTFPGSPRSRVSVPPPKPGRQHGEVSAARIARNSFAKRAFERVGWKTWRAGWDSGSGFRPGSLVPDSSAPRHPGKNSVTVFPAAISVLAGIAQR